MNKYDLAMGTPPDVTDADLVPMSARKEVIRSPEAEAYWRERITQELQVEAALQAPHMPYDYTIRFKQAAAFVRGNKREGQDEASPKG